MKVRWEFLAIPASLVPILLIGYIFDINLDQIFAVGFIPFIVAITVTAAKLFSQGLKFNYLVNRFIGHVDTNMKVVAVRMGSEFVTSTTPSFVAGEIIRVLWLKNKGVEIGKASWVTVMEIVTEVLVGGSLALVAASFTLIDGNFILGFVVMAVSVTTMTIWGWIFFFSSKRTFQIPTWFYKTLSSASKQHMTNPLDKINLWMKQFCNASKENLHARQTKPAFLISMMISTSTWLLYGLSFMVIANGDGYFVGFFHSLMATMAANAIGNIPVTIGGSGLTEIGIMAYLQHLNLFSLHITKNSLPWSIAIVWRLVSYHASLVISWLFLMKAIYPIKPTQGGK